MTYNEWLISYLRALDDRVDMRRGQLAFNMLSKVHPDLAGQINSTGLDPFHDDEVIPAFLAHVAENWGTEWRPQRPEWLGPRT